MKDRLLKRPEVEAITGLSRAAIYARIKDFAFPLPVRLGPNSVAWRESEVQEWIGGLQKATELRGGGVNRVRECAPGPARTGPGAEADTAGKRRA